MPSRKPRLSVRKFLGRNVKELEVPAGKDVHGEYPGGSIHYLDESPIERSEQRFLNALSAIESLADSKLIFPPEIYSEYIREWLSHTNFKGDLFNDNRFMAKFIRKLGFSLSRLSTGFLAPLSDGQIERFVKFVARFYSEFLEGVEGRIQYKQLKTKIDDEEIFKRKRRFQAALGRKQYAFAMALNKALTSQIHDVTLRALLVFKLTGVNPLKDNQQPRVTKQLHKNR